MFKQRGSGSTPFGLQSDEQVKVKPLSLQLPDVHESMRLAGVKDARIQSSDGSGGDPPNKGPVLLRAAGMRDRADDAGGGGIMSGYTYGGFGDIVDTYMKMTGRGPVAYPTSSREVEEILYRVSAMFGPSCAESVRNVLMGGGDTSDREALQRQLKQYAEAFQKLQKQASPYAFVTATRKDKVVLNVMGKTVEVERPDGKDVRPGMTVKVVADTFQILDVVTDVAASGEVATVSRVCSPTLCEIDRAGTTRAVAYSGPLEEGDRVVLDPSGSVAVANIGKPPNENVVAEATGVTWDDIGGLEEAKRMMREAVESPTKHAALMARYGKRPIRGVLLYGAPGCGKTMLCKAAATAMAELHGNAAAGAFFYVKGPALLNMYVGNSEENVRKLFAQARRHKARTGHSAIIFIDEADAILGKRGDGRGLSSTIVPAFLAEMDGLEDSGALVVLATNRPDTLDPAVVRDGRIDRRIKVTRPSREDARAIVSRLLTSRPTATDQETLVTATIDALYDKSLALYHVRKHTTVNQGVPMTLGHIVNGAMLAGIVDRATSEAMHRELSGAAGGVTDADMREAVRSTFRQAQDIDHTEEVAEFIEGWESEVCGIAKAGKLRVPQGIHVN